MNSILVTGDSRGLGAQIAEQLLEETEYRALGISSGESDQTRELSEQYPDRYRHLKFDLSQPSQIESLYEEELKPLGPLCGLVNNAAIPHDDLVSNIRFKELQQLFAVNVLSPIMLSKYTLRDMILNGTEGSLVHVSSVSTATGYKGLSMYGSTKGALESFSLGVAREWGQRGIRSNCVAPGFMETQMTSDLNDQQKERIYDRTSLGKPTDMDDVAEMVVFLLSDAAASITGEVIRIDSGTL